ADEEVVDVVLAGVDAGGEARPRDRRLRGLRALQLGEGAGVGQLLEVRELAFLHEFTGQRRVHSVEAHDRYALLGAAHGLPGGGPEVGAGETRRESEAGEEEAAGSLHDQQEPLTWSRAKHEILAETRAGPLSAQPSR